MNFRIYINHNVQPDLYYLQVYNIIHSVWYINSNLQAKKAAEQLSLYIESLTAYLIKSFNVNTPPIDVNLYDKNELFKLKILNSNFLYCTSMIIHSYSAIHIQDPLRNDCSNSRSYLLIIIMCITKIQRISIKVRGYDIINWKLYSLSVKHV